MFTGQMLVRFRQAQEAVDFVADVAEAAGLAAVAVDGEVFAAQSLLHEVGDDAAVVELHARAVGVEDADDARIDLVIAVIGHGDGFGEALGFVVDRARADGIHVAPVGFFLRMLERIAVALGGGRDQILRAVFVGDVEGVKGSERADLAAWRCRGWCNRRGWRGWRSGRRNRLCRRRRVRKCLFLQTRKRDSFVR